MLHHFVINVAGVGNQWYVGNPDEGFRTIDGGHFEHELIQEAHLHIAGFLTQTGAGLTVYLAHTERGAVAAFGCAFGGAASDASGRQIQVFHGLEVAQVSMLPACTDAIVSQFSVPLFRDFARRTHEVSNGAGDPSEFMRSVAQALEGSIRSRPTERDVLLKLSRPLGQIDHDCFSAFAPSWLFLAFQQTSVPGPWRVRDEVLEGGATATVVSPSSSRRIRVSELLEDAIRLFYGEAVTTAMMAEPGAIPPPTSQSADATGAYQMAHLMSAAVELPPRTEVEPLGKSAYRKSTPPAISEGREEVTKSAPAPAREAIVSPSSERSAIQRPNRTRLEGMKLIVIFAGVAGLFGVPVVLWLTSPAPSTQPQAGRSSDIPVTIPVPVSEDVGAPIEDRRTIVQHPPPQPAISSRGSRPPTPDAIRILTIQMNDEIQSCAASASGDTITFSVIYQGQNGCAAMTNLYGRAREFGSCIDAVVKDSRHCFRRAFDRRFEIPFRYPIRAER